jgi:hypothetical protein
MILPRCTRYDNPVGLMNQAPTDESSPYDKKAEKIQDKEKLGF